MKRFRLIIIIIAIIIFSSCNNKKDNIYQITETYSILSAKNKTTYLSVDLPITYGYQSISNIEVLNTDYYFFEQKDGYQTLNAHLQGDGEEKTIILNYDITLSKGNINWDDNVNDQYLNPSEFIDSDNKKIIESAKSLIVKNDDLDTAKNISKYVSRKIKFDTSIKINQDSLKASEVLEVKKGVCVDYSNLMTALLRAAGIPAKSVSGLVFNRLSNSSDWSSPAGSHAWVEFCVDGEWYFDDPTWGNRYFMNSDGYHLSYGTQIGNINSQEYKNVIHKLEDDGFFIIGAMTAPIKFIAWSDDENTIIVPRVDISKK
jgi:hypothetical protein